MTDVPDLTIGSPAPDFNLPASTGTKITLSDSHTNKNVYLFFVREFN